MLRIAKTVITCLIILGFKCQGQSNTTLKEVLDSLSNVNSRSQRELMEELVKQASALYTEEAKIDERALYHYSLGDFYLERNQVREAMESFHRADSLSEIAGLKELQIRSRSGLGNLYEILGDYLKSIEYQSFALENMKITDGDSSGYYSTLVNLSNAHSGLGKVQLALDYLIQAKKYFARTEQKQVQAIILNNIGELYRSEFNNYPAAIRHLLEAKEINLSLQNFKDLSSNLNNLALAYKKTEHIDSALFYANSNIDLKYEIGDNGGLCQAYYTRATIYLHQNRLDLAQKDYEKSKMLCADLQISIGVYSNLIDLAKIAKRREAYRKALSYLLEAKGLNNKYIRSPTETVVINQELSEVYEKLGDYQKAYFSNLKAERFKDSLRVINNDQKLAGLRSEHEKNLALAENEVLRLKEKAQTEKLNRNRLITFAAMGISLLLLALSIRMYKLSEDRKKTNLKLLESENKLRAEIEKVAKKTKELEESNAMKNQILSVMGHDLRSPLVSVAGLLGTVTAEAITREELQELLALLKTETDRSLISLQNVLNWARLQMEEVKIFRSELKLAELIEEITYQYGPGKRSKNLEIEFLDELNQGLWADENQFKSMCGNLLSNAIKFSPEGSKIRIKAEKIEDGICISICDQGKGMDPQTIQKLNNHEQLQSTRGTKGESGTGIGLRIVYDFIQIHGGRLEFENLEEGGTCAKLIFPFRSKLES